MIPLVRHLYKFIAAVCATVRRPSLSAPPSPSPDTASEPPTESAPVGGTIYPPTQGLGGRWTIPTGHYAAQTLIDFHTWDHLPSGHPDAEQMAQRLLVQVGGSDHFRMWLRASRALVPALKEVKL